MIEYKTPYMILFGVLALILWAMTYWRVFKKPQLYVPKRFRGNKRNIFRIFLFLLGIIAWISIAISLSTPRRPLGFVRSKIEINDIFFVVDVSRSMLAIDFAPNRLAVAKNKIIEFIKMRPTDRIGIIIFAEKVFTLLPLTTDLKLIEQAVTEIKTGGFVGGGTNIGDALGLATARASQSFAKTKIAILMTDGVSNVDSIPPMQAAETAKDQGLRVYTIGIGGKKETRIPVRNSVYGVQYQKLPGGNLDIKTLQGIADITGGRFYAASNESALQNVFSSIQKLEKSEIDVQGRVVYEEFYLKFLIIGVLLLLFVECTRKFIIKEGE